MSIELKISTIGELITKVQTVCRPTSASLETKWHDLHKIEQQKLLKAAFDVH
ncbi:MAG: hypothetical protein OJF51_001350 [Nitrospira sp.]|jgi:hypothetical protein|nr:MAG: hypothetical protein OJF51_001350 [Nitrospira sp.]